MKKSLTALALVAVLGGATWFAMQYRAVRQTETAAAADTLQYDFEAEGVVLRQLDAEGRLRYEIEAERIAQLRNAGGIVASRLTLRHDPPGTTPGSPQQWVVTAEEARVPPDGRVVMLSGSVHARSVPAGSNGVAVELLAGELSYDLDAQEVYSSGEVEFIRGGIRLKGKGLRVNIADGVMRLESGIHGTIPL
jgi:LPS export ABC transporter protein LptC